MKLQKCQSNCRGSYSPFPKYRYHVGICLLSCLHTLQLSIKLCVFDTYIHGCAGFCSPHFCTCCVPGLVWHLSLCVTLLCAHIAAGLARGGLGKGGAGVCPSIQRGLHPTMGFPPQPPTSAGSCCRGWKSMELGVEVRETRKVPLFSMKRGQVR